MKKSVILLLALILPLMNSAFSQHDDAEALYQQHCSHCHGADLRGGNAQSMVDGIWQFGEGRNYIIRNIKFGIPHLGMPSYQETLTDEEIKSIANYIANLEKAEAPEMPPLERNLETLDYIMKSEVFAENLEFPWSIDFVNEELAYITERPGRLRVVENDRLMEQEVTGIPEVLHAGQGGLMDVALHPDYDENGWVYLSYSHVLSNTDNANRPPAMTRIVRGKIKDYQWVEEEVIYESDPEFYSTRRHHYGCRIVFDEAGYLYFSLGDRGSRNQAQDIDKPNGKIHRIYPDGSIPEDNPFYHEDGAIKTIYSYGNRNPQGLAIHPETDELWETEHGPRGGDELNLIRTGINYGWPVITYGLNYSGSPITDIVQKEGMEQPNLYWKPSIAVCGLDFYSGDEFPKWNNHLLVGALKYEEVQLLNITSNRVIHAETIVKNMGRVRDVAAGPDGAIYVVLNKPDAVIRLTLERDKYADY